jgi:polysaccharide deacetylase 2 family uncharacterized protein YibQ
MSPKKKKTKKRRRKIKLRYFILFFLILFLISAYFSYKAFSKEVGNKREELRLKEEVQERRNAGGGAAAQPEKSLIGKAKTVTPKDFKPGKVQVAIPRVAIVVDDLGSNRKPVIPLLEMNVPLTLSILPLETYSEWIAEEGHKRGHEIIAHIPMEAIKENNLGAGGLYTAMTENEIIQILGKNLSSVPYIKGASNHMGSAFTEDERAMSIVMSALKQRGLFFLDSITTSRSVGSRIARNLGVQLFRRDIFLDNGDDPAYIEAQWNKLLGVAQKKGYAVALAHPRENTIEFLRKFLKKNKLRVVPLSELAAP